MLDSFDQRPRKLLDVNTMIEIVMILLLATVFFHLPNELDFLKVHAAQLSERADTGPPTLCDPVSSFDDLAWQSRFDGELLGPYHATWLSLAQSPEPPSIQRRMSMFEVHATATTAAHCANVYLEHEAMHDFVGPHSRR